MAKEFITGLVIGDGVVDYTTFTKGNGQSEKVSSQQVQLDLPAPGESESPEAEVKGEHIVARCGALQGKVTVSLPAEQVLMKIVRLPVVDDDELIGMVELQIDKFSPFPVEDLVVSHEIMATIDEEYVVLIAAVKTEVVDELGQVMAAAGVTFPRVDVSILGWWRLIQDTEEIAATGRHVAVLLHDSAPELVVVHDGVPIAFRSLAGTTGMSGEDFVDDIASELNYTLVSLDREHGPAELDSVSVWHRGDQPKALLKRLSDDCGCPSSPKDAEMLPPLSEGLVRRELADASMNLSPSAWRDVEEARVFKSTMARVATSVLAVWVFGVILFVGGLYLQQMRGNSLERELKEWQVPGREVRSMRRRISVIEKYMDRRSSALECLREISELQPSGVTLALFSYRQSESLKLSGDASVRGQVLEFNNKLDGSKVFAKVIPGQIKRTRGKYRFDFELRFPGGDE